MQRDSTKVEPYEKGERYIEDFPSITVSLVPHVSREERKNESTTAACFQREEGRRNRCAEF